VDALPPLSKSHTEYREGTTLVDMIKEDLIAERIAIESYTEMIAFVGETEPTTRRLFEWVLGQEEEYADDLADLLRSFDGEKTRT
jgi:bacterioferritin